MADKPTFKRALKACIPNSNTTYHATDIGSEALGQLILSKRNDN
jgi:hypothetical protein